MEPDRKRAFKNAIYESIASVGKVLANGHRLELLDLLSQADRGVDELAKMSGMSLANTSRHLQLMRGAGLVTSRREGVRRIYRLTDESAYRLWASLRDYSDARVPEIDRILRTYLEDRESLEAISAVELQKRIEAGEIELIDLRPREEFEAGHLPGARSVPLANLDSMLDRLPANLEVIAYCRGRYCVYSDEAARRLADHGFRVRRFEGNPRDWSRVGCPA